MTARAETGETGVLVPIRRTERDEVPDEDPFQALYLRHESRIRAHVLRRLRGTNVHRVDDLTQEVFLVAWRRIDALPSDPQQALLWLFGIARRVLSNEFRSIRRGDRLVDRIGRLEVADGTPGTPETAALQSDRRRSVRSVLGLLSEADQELLILTEWEGLSAAEVAIALGATPATVRTRLHRARRRFATAFEREVPR